jgi:hypothetical protein
MKKKMSKELLKGFDTTKPLRDIFLTFWRNSFEFILKNRDLYQYSEQFSNSPYSELVDHAELEKHFLPFINVVEEGIRQKIIKNVPFEILAVFIFYPVMNLSNPKMCKNLEFNNELIEKSFNLAWDAIKL